MRGDWPGPVNSCVSCSCWLELLPVSLARTHHSMSRTGNSLAHATVWCRTSQDCRKLSTLQSKGWGGNWKQACFARVGGGAGRCQMAAVSRMTKVTASLLHSHAGPQYKWGSMLFMCVFCPAWTKCQHCLVDGIRRGYNAPVPRPANSPPRTSCTGITNHMHCP